MYNPDILPRIGMNKVQYQNGTTTSINHFYEKLFKLKDLMNTETAKKIANQRHEFMVTFVEEFLNEWKGQA